nr:hypothetical protein KPHV_29660 [Kitasatospora purpeofusca]
MRGMDLALKVFEVVGGESEALLRWLREERSLRGQARISAHRSQPPAPGEMGGISLEVVNVVLSNAIALSSLLTTIAAWRSSRPAPRPSVTIEANGASVTVETSDPEIIRSLVEALRRNDACPGSEPGAPGADPTSIS